MQHPVQRLQLIQRRRIEVVEHPRDRLHRRVGNGIPTGEPHDVPADPNPHERVADHAVDLLQLRATIGGRRGVHDLSGKISGLVEVST
jgi:hypothetical protein